MFFLIVSKFGLFRKKQYGAMQYNTAFLACRKMSGARHFVCQYECGIIICIHHNVYKMLQFIFFYYSKKGVLKENL